MKEQIINVVRSQADQDVASKIADKTVDKTNEKKRTRNIWNGIKQFYHKPIVKAIRESALYNLMKAFILVFLLLLLLFSIHPKEAFICAELQKKKDDYIWLQADELELRGVQTYEYITALDGISLDLAGISVNGIEYSNGDKLVVSPNEKNWPVTVSFWGHTESIQLINTTTKTNCQTDFYAQSINIRTVGDITMRIEHESNAEIIKKDGGRESITVDFLNGLELNDASTQRLKNSGAYDSIKIIYPDIDDRPYELKLSIFDASSKDESYLDVFIPMYDSINSNSVSDCKLVASGDLFFSYKPSPEEYAVRGQELSFAASKQGFSLSFDKSNTSASESPVLLSGYVREARLSNMNLFPDFWAWYYSNLFLVPLTLISTVLAATSMFKASKKGSDEERQPKDSKDK